jgi:urease accessory protein
MLHIAQRLGNISTDAELHDQTVRWREEDSLDEMPVDEHEARKSRLRLRTHKGREVALVLPRGMSLAEGDVFTLVEVADRVLVHVALQDVMVLTPRDGREATDLVFWYVRLGHVLGNQHWPIAIDGRQVLTPVAVDQAVMETVLRTHHLTDHFTIHYERRSWPTEEGISQWTTHHS